MAHTGSPSIAWMVTRFLIGSVLLFICWLHLQQNEAEKISLVSGFKVLYQKSTIVRENIVGQDGDILSEQFSLVKSYEEVVRNAEARCVGLPLVETVNKSYLDLKTQSLAVYKEKRQYYVNHLHEIMAQVQEICPDKGMSLK
ncbi:MAG TPA: hypothetical protein PKD96_02780 [Candidatus Absconditabacterales bacterium]|nr:hypothetical protein [Candidatus Absconditabacterales bacterium]HMT27203.1 hypothetical protein [Candidatus Absconditabacterales bacterium]